MEKNRTGKGTERAKTEDWFRGTVLISAIRKHLAEKVALT